MWVRQRSWLPHGGRRRFRYAKLQFSELLSETDQQIFQTLIDILASNCYNYFPFRYLKREYSAGSRRGS